MMDDAKTRETPPPTLPDRISAHFHCDCVGPSLRPKTKIKEKSQDDDDEEEEEESMKEVEEEVEEEDRCSVRKETVKEQWHELRGWMMMGVKGHCHG